jgi:hypothetical protein
MDETSDYAQKLALDHPTFHKFYQEISSLLTEMQRDLYKALKQNFAHKLPPYKLTVCYTVNYTLNCVTCNVEWLLLTGEKLLSREISLVKFDDLFDLHNLFVQIHKEFGKTSVDFLDC